MPELIPENWAKAQLGDLGTVITGKTPSTKEPNNFGGDIPFIKPGDLDIGGIITETVDTLSDRGFKLVPNLPEKTIVVTCIGNLGKVGITSKASATNQQLNSVIPSDGVEYKYLYYYMRSMKSWLEQEASATTVAIINKGKFSKAPVLLPSQPEQKQIAAKLDELLSQVDTLKTRLDAIPAILKRFRQSVLAAAVSGRLTEEWRMGHCYKAEEQLARIKELIRSKPPKYDLAKFHELPDSWAWALVKQVGSVQLGRQRAPKYHEGENMRPYLRVANVMEGYIDTSDVMDMVFDEDDFEKYRLSEGDILLNEGQSHELVGRPAIYRGEVEGACFTNTLVRFRPFGDISNDFSYLVFLSYLKTGRFQEVASRTVNISHLGAGRFADMEFPFPPIEEQTKIVHRVEQLFTFADQIGQRVKDAQSGINHLVQSILAKAFRGELTTEWREQNPDLISGEHSTEALLEKIKAEKIRDKSKKKVRKDKIVA